MFFSVGFIHGFPNGFSTRNDFSMGFTDVSRCFAISFFYRLNHSFPILFLMVSLWFSPWFSQYFPHCFFSGVPLWFFHEFSPMAFPMVFRNDFTKWLSLVFHWFSQWFSMSFPKTFLHGFSPWIFPIVFQFHSSWLDVIHLFAVWLFFSIS